jgi:hypothetical protein
MRSLQGRGFSDASMRDELGKAVSRINNLSLVRDRLQAFTSGSARMDARALPAAMRDAAIACAGLARR